MTGSRQPQINEELLSAYLDDEVTAAERALVEAAIAADPAVARQVESLRQTIYLLQALPPLALPRAFTLDLIVADAQATPVVTAPQAESAQPRAANPRPRRARPTTDEQPSNGWQWLRQIWQGGNLQLRNAAAVAFTLLIVLFMRDQLVTPTYLRQPTAVPGPSAKLVTTTEGVTTTSAAIVMTTAPIETATNLAQTVATPPLVAEAGQADNVQATPAPSAKTAPDQDSTTASQGVAKQQPSQPGPPGEDTLDMRGGQSGGFGDQLGQGESMSAMMTDDSRALATDSRGPAALTQAAPNAAANQADQAPNTVAAAAASALAMTATLTVTPTATVTATVTATAILSVTGQTELLTNTGVFTAPPVPIAGVPAAPPMAVESWLAWAKMMAGVCTVVLGGLWWRSRGVTHA